MKSTQGFLTENSTTILTVVASVGVVATAVLAARGKPDADDRLEAYTDDKVRSTPDGQDVKVSPLEVIKVVWRPYLPATITGVGTIICIVGANQIGLRRNAALVAAYSLVDRTLREYQDKVVEKLGPTEEKKVRDEIAQERINNNPPPVIIMGKGDTTCLDLYTGRYFKSDIEDIRRAVNDFNRDVNEDHHAPLNVFWGYLGLDPVMVGDVMGYNADKLLEIQFTSALLDNTTPVIAIHYRSLPRVDYEDWC
jgi:hypothetical protein